MMECGIKGDKKASGDTEAPECSENYPSFFSYVTNTEVTGTLSYFTEDEGQAGNYTFKQILTVKEYPEVVEY